MPAGKWELKHLLNMFKQELTSHEKCLSMSPTKQVPPVNPVYYTLDKNNFSASSLHSGTYKAPCSFCKMEHPSNKCDVVTHLSARKAILQEKQKCFNCLRTGHIVKNCSANSKCYLCDGKHHISICGKKARDQDIDYNQQQRPNNSMSMLINSAGHTLLQTAKAWISNPENDKNAVIGRVLFDNCSQQTFVTEKLISCLKLQTSHTEQKKLW